MSLRKIENILGNSYGHNFVDVWCPYKLAPQYKKNRIDLIHSPETMKVIGSTNRKTLHPISDNYISLGSFYVALTKQFCEHLFSNTKNPKALSLTRQNLEYLDFSIDYEEFLNGGYVVSDGKDITIFASGSELNIAFDLKDRLNKYSVKIVSVPVLNRLTPENALSLNSTKFTFTLELGKSIGWGDYIGNITESISVESFGSSAPQSDLSKYFKIDVHSIEKRIKSYLN